MAERRSVVSDAQEAAAAPWPWPVVLAFLDWLIQGRETIADVEGLRVGRLTAGVALLFVLNAGYFVLVGLALDFDRSTEAICVVALVAFGATLAYLRMTGNVRAAAIMLMTQLVCLVSLASLVSGGIRVLASPWGVFLPIVGTYLAGARAGRMVSGIMAVECVAVFWLEKAGYLHFPFVSAWPEGDLVSAIAVLVLVAAVSPLYDYAHQQARASLERALAHLKEMQQRLVLTDRLASMGLLAGGVAHEINNPLTFVSTNLELLAEAAAEGDTARTRELILEAREGAERICRIVADLKTFSRGADEGEGPVAIAGVLAFAAKVTEAELRHRARVELNCEDGIAVAGSGDRLMQVFVNLLINAAQALPEGKADRNLVRIDVARSAGDRVLITILDTGCGISRDVLDHVFDPFFTTKPVGVGTGLGLSITYSIVKAMGGEVAIESEPGRGTTVRLDLPEAASAASTTPHGGASGAQPPAKAGVRLRVLAVDDEPIIGLLIRRILEPAYDVDAAESAREALDLIEGGKRYDVILCDLLMPERTGMDFYEALSLVAPGQQRRITFMTGGAFTERARSFLDGVPNRRLDKPFVAADLRAAVLRAAESLAPK